MNLEELENKSILLYGKSRAFSSEEFDAQIKSHNISVVKDYSQDVVLVVDGRMMTPYEENSSEELYKKSKESGSGLEFISIDVLEKELASHIDADVLLMSLKLSHDKDRLKSFLQNSMISDELFLKLLKMYSWSGEDFFENDDNRDVSAALILRFYKNIERNHNVQYSTLGLMHLVVQSKDGVLIEAISELEPLVKSLKNDNKDSKHSIITAIATHHQTPEDVLRRFIKDSTPYVQTLVAMRKNCCLDMQQSLYETQSEMVHEALSHNVNLDIEIVVKLLDNPKYAKNIAKNILLNDEIFQMLLEDYKKELAQNESLSPQMQERLVSYHDEDISIALASNEHLSMHVEAELLCEDSHDINYAIYSNPNTSQERLEEAFSNKLNYIALANNENTPIYILEILAKSEDEKVLLGLAKNENTPIEILYQLQLDARFERFVKENKSFGKHIQTQNIGWEV